MTAWPAPWPGLGAMVDRLSAFAPDPYGNALRDAAGTATRYMMFKAHHGTTRDDANLIEALDFGAIRAHHELGARIGIWGQLVPDEDPAAQATLAVGLCRELEDELGWPKGALFYGANDEIQGHLEFAETFTEKFRTLAPLRHAFVIPLGLGFLGGDGRYYPAAVNLAPYRFHRFRDLCETYEGNMTEQAIANVLLAHRLYFTAPKPLLAGTTPNPNVKAWAFEMDHARRLGAFVKGAAVFPGERLHPDKWRELGHELRARKLIA